MTWLHGRRFHYVSPNTDLLGVVVERGALLTVDGSGTAVISGGFFACLRDYARLGQLIADAGAGIGITVLSSQPEALDPCPPGLRDRCERPARPGAMAAHRFASGGHPELSVSMRKGGVDSGPWGQRPCGAPAR
ncbi:MAG TPA: hypothetical protein VHW04_07965 [Solirubrobacteraceae bacterium]|nr:hypothetical protein [Solirubrobacteraceae bacterium]